MVSGCSAWPWLTGAWCTRGDALANTPSNLPLLIRRSWTGVRGADRPEPMHGARGYTGPLNGQCGRNVRESIMRWFPGDLRSFSLGCLAVVVVVSGCSSSSENGDRDESGRPPLGSKTNIDPRFDGQFETRGRMAAGSLWALFYHRRAGDEVKTLWRMTGRGELSLKAVGPGGTTLKPEWGPESHGSTSTWRHPGDEWGAGWTIPEPGRWTFHARLPGGRHGTVTVVFG